MQALPALAIPGKVSCGTSPHLNEQERNTMARYIDDDPTIRRIAREIYGDVEIDDDAQVQPATEGGSWVAAWVYVSNKTLDEYGEREEMGVPE
jgi:hypothetical protein